MSFLNRFGVAVLSATLPATAFFTNCLPARAADHGEAPLVAQDQGADIGDVYFFLDPNDNTKVVMAMDVHGFIVPSENENLGNFDPTVRFQFQVENTGDAKPDMFFSVTFTPLVTKTVGQTATIRIEPSGQTFTAPATASDNIAATGPTQVVTTDSTTGISFFAGLTDDPFFFDIPAFTKFVASANAGHPDTTVFSRGRDSFAGYNINMIALEVPVELIRGASNNTHLGLSCVTQRRRVTTVPITTRPYNPAVHGTNGDGAELETGKFRNIDRMGNPAINTVFVPQNRKDEYNRLTPEDDAADVFAADIAATAHKLGVDDAHIAILAQVAIADGDYLHLNTTMQNTGIGGGNNAGVGFPNGRRPQDDVVDTLLTIINNGQTLGDNVNGNDVAFRNRFPFFAKPHQPQANGVIDDGTRN